MPPLPSPVSPSLPPANTAVLVIGAPASNAGKTTVTCGLIAAFAARGLDVRCYKCGPDFIDGMHHAAAVKAGKRIHAHRNGGGATTDDSIPPTRTANLDGWMQGSPSAVRSTFHRHRLHSTPADVCIIEGVMGLHDSRDGTSDEGSTAQIAKILNAPVILVVDASACARSVAATALGHGTFDPRMRLGGVVANMIGGGKDGAHVRWIRDAVESASGVLRDCGTDEPAVFFGGLPRDEQCSIPERHLGLHMPDESEEATVEASRRFDRLVALMEENLDLDGILELGRTCSMPMPSLHGHSQLPMAVPTYSGSATTTQNRCRIGIADDAAFCFYYADNLHLLKQAGAELVPFSPLSSPHLPPNIDGLYFGGGYPELHAAQLERNEQLRKDVLSFCNSGAAVFAECGGLMYLADTLIAGRDDPTPRKMCGVFQGLVVRMTRHCTMYYATIAITKENPVFYTKEQHDKSNNHGGDSLVCRGQEFHYSEVVAEDASPSYSTSPVLITPERPDAKPIPGGYAHRNTFASYLHFFFASKSSTTTDPSGGGSDECGRTGSSLADDFIASMIRNSPGRGAKAVSFVSAATEIAFALGAGASLSGVTSVCDFPPEARHSPRRVICRSRIDASTMTSEEVTRAVKEMKKARDDSMSRGKGDGPPGHWLIDNDALKELSPTIVFVQNTCDICDASSDDVMHSLSETGLMAQCRIVPVAPTTLNGVLQSILTVGRALDVEEEATDLISQLERRLDYLQNEISLQADCSRPRVLSLEGLAPLCSGGGWLPDIKLRAGCEDAMGDTGGCPPRILTWEQISEADPDVLLLSPCSASPQRTMDELHLLASASEFWALRCVKRGDVYILDHAKFSRPGPRIVDGAEMLAALLRGVKFDAGTTKEWDGEAFKYECDVSDIQNDGTKTHCTTELAMRFRPCFGGLTTSSEKKVEEDTTNVPCKSLLKRCRVIRCTIPGFPLPQDRSAHTMVSVTKTHSKDDFVLLFGGEAEDGSRLSDVWKLTPPSCGWNKVLSSSTNPGLGELPTWEMVRCGKIYGENVPTLRSNHASVVCGDYLLVYGGWGSNNMDPLSNCELLHLDTFCWTHCSTIGDLEPSPRGNPTLVFFELFQSAILFGGWNGKCRFNDTWKLDMVTWAWEEITFKAGEIPAPRTDHSAVLWKRGVGLSNDAMILFGGSVEGNTGASSELWLLDCVLNDESHWRWSQIDSVGPCPPGRTSHAATIIGDGNAAKMIVVGGNDATVGSGRSGILKDAWVLSLSMGIAGKVVGKWEKLDWSGCGIDRCRHSMVTIGQGGDAIIAVWGGFDGTSTTSDDATLHMGSVENVLQEGAVAETSRIEATAAHRLQERWEAEIPVTLDDLPADEVTKAKRSKLPGAMWKALHRYAVSQGRDTYIDPSSGYSVFTQLYLKRKACCGNSCRHCPHGHVNVPPKSLEDKGAAANDDTMKKSLDW